VQRYYPAVPGRPGPQADFAIAGQIGQRLGLEMEARSASKVMSRIAAARPGYDGAPTSTMEVRRMKTARDWACSLPLR